MFWISCICVICLLVCLPLYMHYRGKLQIPLSAAFKSMGTLCAFSLSLIAAIRLDERCYICVAALFFHAISDYAMEFHYMLGRGFSLAGHICFIAFFSMLTPVSGSHLIVLLLLLAFTAYLFIRWRKQIGSSLLPQGVYGLSVCVMCAFSVSCFSSAVPGAILIACGGALFFFSETLLFRVLLFPSGRAMEWIVMISYYAAQLLFGIACLKL